LVCLPVAGHAGESSGFGSSSAVAGRTTRPIWYKPAHLDVNRLRCSLFPAGGRSRLSRTQRPLILTLTLTLARAPYAQDASHTPYAQDASRAPYTQDASCAPYTQDASRAPYADETPNTQEGHYTDRAAYTRDTGV
jgi:hypothetical protein